MSIRNTNAFGSPTGDDDNKSTTGVFHGKSVILSASSFCMFHSPNTQLSNAKAQKSHTNDQLIDASEQMPLWQLLERFEFGREFLLPFK
jgi:hypothetical protein